MLFDLVISWVVVMTFLATKLCVNRLQACKLDFAKKALLLNVFGRVFASEYLEALPVTKLSFKTCIISKWLCAFQTNNVNLTRSIFHASFSR
jgi:hypothetical protein